MIRLSTAAFITSIFFLSCNNRPASDKVERPGHPTIYSVAGTDREMNDAIDMARATLPSFDSALRTGNLHFRDFALKARFNTNSGGEHIWVGNISIGEGSYAGIVGNLPNETNEVHLGDTVQLTRDKISDWMYIEDGVLRGGYTIRLLRSRMSESERNTFDRENGIIIKD